MYPIYHIASLGECMKEHNPDNPDAMGGDALNTAYYARIAGAPYGVASHFATVAGNDAIGSDMKAAWTGMSLNPRNSVLVGDAPSAAYTPAVEKKDYKYENRGRAFGQLCRHPDWLKLFDLMLRMDALHTTLVTLALLDEESRDEVVNMFKQARKRGVQTSFDTNYRASLWSGGAAEAAAWTDRIAVHADIFMPTDEDGEQLYGLNAHELSHRFGAMGSDLVLCKRGTDPTLVQHKGVVHEVPVTPAKAVDPTAAGDSCGGGFLAALAHGYDPVDAAKVGHAMARVVVQHKGALVPPTAFRPTA